MKREWTKVLDHLCDPATDYTEMAVTFVWSLRKCPKCRCLVAEEDTLMHELECWK